MKLDQIRWIKALSIKFNDWRHDSIVKSIVPVTRTNLPLISRSSKPDLFKCVEKTRKLYLGSGLHLECPTTTYENPYIYVFLRTGVVCVKI